MVSQYLGKFIGDILHELSEKSFAANCHCPLAETAGHLKCLLCLWVSWATPGLCCFPLRQGKSLPEHCFPQTKKKLHVNTPEILKHCCLPCGSPCNGVWLYNALHRNEECTAAFNSLPVDSLHIFLQETQPFLYLFLPHT